MIYEKFGFTKIYDGSKYLVLLGPEKYDAMCDRVTYHVSPKSGIKYIFSHYFTKIKVDSYNSLPIEKILSLHNVKIHIKSVLNKDKYHYYFRKMLVSIS